MSPKRAEPFPFVLQSLRDRLREGRFALDHRLAATEIADELRLSATPVREALARLAGEGLLEERRGQGYFVRRLTALDIADLYRLAKSNLDIALEPRRLRVQVEVRPAWLAELGPVEGAEQLFDRWVSAAGSLALRSAQRGIQARLAPVRRLEPQLIDGLEEELRGLAECPLEDDRRRLALVASYYRRRIRLADRLAVLLERPAPL